MKWRWGSLFIIDLYGFLLECKEINSFFLGLLHWGVFTVFFDLFSVKNKENGEERVCSAFHLHHSVWWLFISFGCYYYPRKWAFRNQKPISFSAFPNSWCISPLFAGFLGGFFSNVLSALLKWLWSLPTTTTKTGMSFWFQLKKNWLFWFGF